MQQLHPLSWLVAAAALQSAPQPAAPGPQAEPAPEHSGPAEWGPREVEHLMNRAGFGATREDLARGLELGPAGLVRDLAREAEWERVEPVLIRWEDFDLDPAGVPVPPEQSKYKDVSRKQAAEIKSELARTDHAQFMDYVDAYFRSMIDGDAPLNDRMTLFWHGFFTTASPVVLRKFELINQHQFLRENALGNFRTLLHGIVRDPGMLQYLDNNTNVAGHPNENLARELMELYSLGEGNYTEVDVREAARALTGAHAGADGLFSIHEDEHDAGLKTVLGVTGPLKGAELVEILLDQEACPRWVAWRILSYFEGLPPTEERLADYAAFLREHDYELRPFMERLLLDPAFYRDEVVAARVQSPIDFIVGACRKTGLEPAPYVPFRITVELGEGLYQPPSVKGWEGGESWITSNLLLQRGNSLGALLGTLPTPPAAEEQEGTMGEPAMMEPGLEERARGALVSQMYQLAKVHEWHRELALAADFRALEVQDDRELARAALEEWLAIEAPERLVDEAAGFLARERERRGIEADSVLESDQAEDILRSLAHLVFSLPEAQLG